VKRFLLRPDESARENLWRAVQMACRVVCTRYRWYGLVGDSRLELLDELELASYVHFMHIKIRGKGYKRVAANGKKLSFFDNVLSSAWAVSGHAVKKYISTVVQTRANTLRLEAPQQNSAGEYELIETLSAGDKKLYVSDYKYERKPFGEQTPKQRANTIRAEYAEHLVDCEDMGIGAMDMDTWLDATGYREDSDAMWWLMSREERKAVKKQRKAKEREERKARLEAERKARKEAKASEKLHRELEEIRQGMGNRLDEIRERNCPRLPAGWKFVMRDGVLCITRE